MSEAVRLIPPGGLKAMQWRITAADGGVYWMPEQPSDPTAASIDAWVVEEGYGHMEPFRYRRTTLDIDQIVTMTNVEDMTTIKPESTKETP